MSTLLGPFFGILLVAFSSAVFLSLAFINCLCWVEGAAFCATRGCANDVFFLLLLQFFLYYLSRFSLVCDKAQQFLHLHYAIFDIHGDLSLDMVAATSYFLSRLFSFLSFGLGLSSPSR